MQRVQASELAFLGAADFLLDVRIHGVQFRLRLGEGHPRSQPPDHAQEEVVAVVGATQLEVLWEPDVHLTRDHVREVWTHHADHRIGRTVQREARPDDVPVRVGVFPPEVVTQDHETWRPELFFVGERPPEQWCRAVHVEVVRADPKGADALRPAGAGQVESRFPIRVQRGQFLERVDLVAKVHEVRSRHEFLGGRRRVPGAVHADQSVGLIVGERAQDHAVQHAEHGGGGAYA